MSGRGGSAMLAPLGWAYGRLVAWRNRRYDRPGAVRAAGLPVLSIGNLTVGGTGKTPLCAWICRRLIERGRKPAVLSRGYGGRAGRGPVVVSEGRGPIVASVLSGDEPFMLARTVEGLRVVVGADRLAGAAAATALGADVIVLDDGFQHRRIARDLDIVLLDARQPLDRQRLLPAGRLREPLHALGRAGLIVATRTGSPDDVLRVERAVRPHNESAPVIGCSTRVVGFVDAAGAPAAAPRRALAFCAIGSPDGFRRDLETQGIALAGFRAFRDHHRFSRRELAALRARAESAGAVLVTTEKDLARLDPGESLLALRIVPWLTDPAPLCRAVETALGGGAP